MKYVKECHECGHRVTAFTHNEQMYDEYDEYGEIINCEEAFTSIALLLATVQTVLIGWTDQAGTHFDILLTNKANFMRAGFQGGIKPTDLFVSIMRLGAFSFKKQSLAEGLHPNYIGEKLHLGGGITAEKLAELLQGVCKKLIQMESEE